jgi:Zn-dependent protease
MTVISILLGGFLIGWAKPTPVNPNNLKDRRNDEVLVAVAGPLSNLAMAVLGAIVVRIVVAAEVHVPDFVALALVNFVVFNVMLAIFNLIPIPPLDGANVLFRFLPLRMSWQIRPFLAQYGIFIILGFVLLASRLLSGLIYGVAFALMGVG